MSGRYPCFLHSYWLVASNALFAGWILQVEMTMHQNSGLVEATMHTQEIKIGKILTMNKEIGVTGCHQQHFTGGLLSNQLMTIPP
jgi:hypothetical protein